MPRRKIGALAVAALLGAGCSTAPAEATAGHWGQVAFGWVEKLVELGPRYPGSPGHAAQLELLKTELAARTDRLTIDAWDAETPRGTLPMANVIAQFGPESETVVVISGHIDTLRRDNLPNFVGANDGGSSTALLLTLADRFSAEPPPIGVWLAFFDGEEAQIEWLGEDNTYGSRRLAKQWVDDGTAQKIRALINVDMIGDGDLALTKEMYSTDWLRELVWETAHDAGYYAEFPSRSGYVADDHIPFVNAGIPAIDLIDFNYGPSNSYWHTEDDAINKLSPRSFEVMVDVLAKVVDRLAVAKSP